MRPEKRKASRKHLSEPLHRLRFLDRHAAGVKRLDEAFQLLIRLSISRPGQLKRAND